MTAPRDKYQEHHEKAWALLPDQLKVRAIRVLRRYVQEQDLAKVRELHAEHGHEWVDHEPFAQVLQLPGREGEDAPVSFPWHMGGGMAVRNLLRNNDTDSIPDAELPDLSELYGEPPGSDIRNWDDFYVAAFEAAAGIRPVPDEGATMQSYTRDDYTTYSRHFLRRTARASARRARRLGYIGVVVRSTMRGPFGWVVEYLHKPMAGDDVA